MNRYALPYNALRNTDCDLIPENQEEFLERNGEQTRKEYTKVTNTLSRFLKEMDAAKRLPNLSDIIIRV